MLHTHVSWGSTGCREHTARVLHLGETKVRDHDLGVFIQAVVQQILWLGRGRERKRQRWPDAGRTICLPKHPSKTEPPKSHCGFTAAILVEGT